MCLCVSMHMSARMSIHSVRRPKRGRSSSRSQWGRHMSMRMTIHMSIRISIRMSTPMSIGMPVRISNMPAYMDLYMHTHTQVCPCACLYTCACPKARVCIYACIRVSASLSRGLRFYMLVATTSLYLRHTFCHSNRIEHSLHRAASHRTVPCRAVPHRATLWRMAAAMARSWPSFGGAAAGQGCHMCIHQEQRRRATAEELARVEKERRIQACLHTCPYTRLYACLCTCPYTCLYACPYRCPYTCLYAWHTHVFTHVYTHVHTHAYLRMSNLMCRHVSRRRRLEPHWRGVWRCLACSSMQTRPISRLCAWTCAWTCVRACAYRHVYRHVYGHV